MTRAEGPVMNIQGDAFPAARRVPFYGVPPPAPAQTPQVTTM